MVRPKTVLGAACNALWDGNSLCQGVGGAGHNTGPATHVHGMATTGAGTFTNAGIGGQAWADMIANATDVDNAWQAGKTNVLFTWEHNNTLVSFNEYDRLNTSLPVQACLNQCRQYNAGRRALHPWLIIGISTTPSEWYSVAAQEALNRQKVEVDTAIAANPGYYGYDLYINLRQKGSPFDLPDWSQASFSAAGNIWFEAPGGRVHLNDNGYILVANMVEERLRNLRGVPHQ